MTKEFDELCKLCGNPITDEEAQEKYKICGHCKEKIHEVPDEDIEQISLN